MASSKFQIKYSHSIFWLIFWMIIFFPFGLVLLLSHAHIVSGGRRVRFIYDGSRFWLFFWALVFFPITILLLLFKGSFVKKS